MRAPAGRAATTQAPYGLDHLLLKLAIQINSLVLQQSLVFLAVCTTLQALRTFQLLKLKLKLPTVCCIFPFSSLKAGTRLTSSSSPSSSLSLQQYVVVFFQPGLSKLGQTKNSSSKLQAPSSSSCSNLCKDFAISLNDDDDDNDEA